MSKQNNGISRTNHCKFSAPREGIEPSCVVLTYSVSPTLDQASIALQGRGASVHYIIDKDGNQYQYHNDLESKTFFAGNSSWKGQKKVNDFGISIMLVNDSESNFTSSQIDRLKACLTDIKERYPDLNIKDDLVGLGEVAEKHVAPGKLFPWKTLAEDGFGKFIDTTKEQQEKILIRKDAQGETVSNVQSQLKNHGYNISVDGICGNKTVQWFEKFNARYVPKQELSNSWSEADQYVLDNLHPNPVVDLVGDSLII
ncbi:N-acetylmuramoyl-L-alanine amidase [Candidatus Tisiphia endosymbiont of Xenochironomus xenolabis]|uniref:N-acetylmuramoyl-L-alanine amidase n=1 Tax=Candidatus Tisiphia endosymbiont of Xenochironomus xenolabis TaxID=3139334 RepID=UPI0035C90F55